MEEFGPPSSKCQIRGYFETKHDFQTLRELISESSEALLEALFTLQRCNM